MSPRYRVGSSPRGLSDEQSWLAVRGSNCFEEIFTRTTHPSQPSIDGGSSSDNLIEQDEAGHS